MPGKVYSQGVGSPALMRIRNERAVFDVLLDRGPTSATDVSILIGLSKPTAYKALSHLVTAEIVEVLAGKSGKCGPDGKLYRVNAGSAHGAGIHITPQRVTARVADILGNVLGEATEPVPARRSAPLPATGLRALERAAAAAGLHPATIADVVIGVPGTVDPRTGRPEPSADPGALEAGNWSAEFTACLGGRPVFESAANLAAFAQQRSDAVAGCHSYLLLWLADRPRLSIVTEGGLYRGVAGRAGLAWAYGSWPGTVGGGLDEGPGAAAEALAPGLTAVSALLCPELVVVAGLPATVPGDELCALLQRALDKDLDPSPRVLPSVPGDPVLAGAVDSALAGARERLRSRAS